MAHQPAGRRCAGDAAGAPTQFVVEAAEEHAAFANSESAAEYVLSEGFADRDREPLRHLRWRIDRMGAEETMEVGEAQVSPAVPAD